MGLFGRSWGAGRGRFAGVLLVVVLLCGVSAGSVSAQVNSSTASSDSDEADRYSDVPRWSDSDRFEPASEPISEKITRLRSMGIFEGTECGEDRFCPFDPVDRKTFAVWMVRVLDGDDAPDFVRAPAGAGTPRPRFADVPTTFREHEFVERLAELRITGGCARNPLRYCPESGISRGLLATYVFRALKLPESEPIGFWDVDEDNRHFDNINRLVGSGIDAGCSELRFVPFHFCPDQRVSRADLAVLLSEVVDYLDASRIIKLNEGSEPDNSIGLAVSYDEDRGIPRVTWNNPNNSLGRVAHYVVQWRPTWEDFNYRRYRVVEFSPGGRYDESLPVRAPRYIYAVRVIAVYDNDDGDQLATDEVKVPSKAHELRDLVERFVAIYGADQPWMVDAWRHMDANLPLIPNGRTWIPDGPIAAKNQVNFSNVHNDPSDPGRLEQPYAGNMYLAGRPVVDNPDPDHREQRSTFSYNSTVAHEMGHVYTMTAGIAKNGLPVAAGWLYVRQLVRDHRNPEIPAGWCKPEELYADLSELAFLRTYDQSKPEYASGSFGSLWYRLGNYWYACEFDLSPSVEQRIIADVKDITESVFLKREVPQWFYSRYGLDDGSIDLDKLWSDILNYSGRTRRNIVYALQNEFGGYCSTEEVRQYFDDVQRSQNSWGEISEPDPIDTPWRDAGGCPNTENN